MLWCITRNAITQESLVKFGEKTIAYCVWLSDVSGISTTRLVLGVISAMAEKELGERIFGFDYLKSRLNRDMEEKGIVTWDCLPPETS